MDGKQKLQVTADICASTGLSFTHTLFSFTFLLNKQYHSVLYHEQLFIWDLILRPGKD